MCDMILEISHPPFGEENTFAAFYVAKVSVLSGMIVTIVLRGDGVFACIKGQKEPMNNINLPPTESQLEEMLELDVKIMAEDKALEKRGILKEDLIEGVEIVSTRDIHREIINGNAKILTF